MHKVVIGGSFGDEGKGIITDYLCAQGAGMVVRFCGGGNAGHTVVMHQLGKQVRHVFSHIGSGTFRGVPTYLSRFFICNPILFVREIERFQKISSLQPLVFAHPDCLVTTFADMMINQSLENQRHAGKKHGSCGVGINETIERSKRIRLTMRDVWARSPHIPDILREICGNHSLYRSGREIERPSQMINSFMKTLDQFASMVTPLEVPKIMSSFVFEGAQGLLLDQDNKEYFPHVTRSSTGIHNVLRLCDDWKIPSKHLDIHYVSRTYLTRHGAGKLPGEDPNMSFSDDTNLPHEYQGAIRFAPLNMDQLFKRVLEDAAGLPYKIVLTHCDQLAPQIDCDLHSYGPTADDVINVANNECRALYKRTA